MPILPTLPVPSTAATTSRFGLMNPVDSDLFKSSDFAATTAILDAVPGTLPVANLAALQALTWTTAQHGTRVLQLDNGAEWYWYQPSGAGVWKRTNSVGLLSNVTQGAAVSTATTGTGPTFLQTSTFTAPGVRPLRIDVRAGVDNSNGLNSVVILTIRDNNTAITDWNIRCGQKINNNGTGFFSSFYILNPTAGSSHQITVQIRCAQMSTAIGGLGTATAHTGQLSVVEV